MPSVVAFTRDAPSRSSGMNARHEQHLTGVDVADADHDVAVHDELLDRDFALTGGIE